jgi:hypothetical protein
VWEKVSSPLRKMKGKSIIPSCKGFSSSERRKTSKFSYRQLFGGGEPPLLLSRSIKRLLHFLIKNNSLKA